MEVQFPQGPYINMDETPLYFDMVPSQTVEKKGVKEVRVKSTGSGKRCVTIVFGLSRIRQDSGTHDHFQG